MVSQILHCPRNQLLYESIFRLQKVRLVVVVQSWLEVELQMVRVPQTQVGLGVLRVNREAPVIGVDRFLVVPICYEI